MKQRKARSLRGEFINCLCVTGAGINLFPVNFSLKLWSKLQPFAIGVSMLVFVVAFYLQFSGGSEEEVDREERDERNRMIQDISSDLGRKVETTILLAAYLIFGLFMKYYTIAIVLYWVLILRFWLYLLLRWWMNRKY